MFRVETYASCDGLRRLFWVLDFVAQRQIGIATWDACSIAAEHEDYRDACPKSDLPLGTPPPMSAPKNKEA